MCPDHTLSGVPPGGLSVPLSARFDLKPLVTATSKLRGPAGLYILVHQGATSTHRVQHVRDVVQLAAWQRS